jgi:hypothetical protein
VGLDSIDRNLSAVKNAGSEASLRTRVSEDIGEVLRTPSTAGGDDGDGDGRRNSADQFQIKARSLQETAEREASFQYEISEQEAQFQCEISEPEAQFQYEISEPEAQFQYEISEPEAQF